MSAYKTKALVLKRIPLGEKDKIVTLYTREYGKLNAVAKGARRTTSRLSGATEPLMYLHGLLAEGMNLDIVTQADVRESFPGLRADFGLFLRATYACELLDRLTVERDPQADYFDLLLSTLYILQRAKDPDAAVHAYELKLMALAGYEPRLDACIRCESAFEGDVTEAAYSPARGGILCDVCSAQTKEETLPFTPAAADWTRRLGDIDDARTLAASEIPPVIMADINRALRAHLRYRLERDVRSTAFLDAFRVGAMDDLTLGVGADAPPATGPRWER